MEIGEVVDETRLEIVLGHVDDNSSADVDDFDIGKMSLGLVNGLIDFLVISNTISEVFGRLFWILSDVVWRCGLDFEDVGHDQVFIVTLAFDEEVEEFGFGDLVEDPLTASFGGVGRVEDGHFIGLVLEPVQHVCDGGFSSGFSRLLALGVVDVEELGIRVRVVGASIFTNIEDFGVDRGPSKVSLD